MIRCACATGVLAATAVVTAVGGCRQQDGAEQDRAVAASGFVPPVTQAPSPVPGQRNATPLTAYVGQYPRDAVDGVTFFDRTEVANALIEVVPEEALRREITGRDATQVPIFRSGDRIAAHGCAPHDCAGHQWTVMIAPDGDVSRAAVCFHDEQKMGATSRWSTREGASARPTPCPQA